MSNTVFTQNKLSSSIISWWMNNPTAIKNKYRTWILYISILLVETLAIYNGYGPDILLVSFLVIVLYFRNPKEIIYDAYSFSIFIFIFFYTLPLQFIVPASMFELLTVSIQYYPILIVVFLMGFFLIGMEHRDNNNYDYLKNYFYIPVIVAVLTTVIIEMTFALPNLDLDSIRDTGGGIIVMFIFLALLGPMLIFYYTIELIPLVLFYYLGYRLQPKLRKRTIFRHITTQRNENDEMNKQKDWNFVLYGTSKLKSN